MPEDSRQPVVLKQAGCPHGPWTVHTNTSVTGEGRSSTNEDGSLDGRCNHVRC